MRPAIDVADESVSAANVTTCDGYYEISIECVKDVIEADRKALVAEICDWLMYEADRKYGSVGSLQSVEWSIADDIQAKWGASHDRD